MVGENIQTTTEIELDVIFKFHYFDCARLYGHLICEMSGKKYDCLTDDAQLFIIVA
jgi:hypothetical protein